LLKGLATQSRGTAVAASSPKAKGESHD
jgi:hypothetical protein